MVASSTWLKDEASLWQRRQHQQQQQQHCLFSAPSANMHCTLSCTLLSLSGMKNLAGINMACEFWSNSPCSFFFFFHFFIPLKPCGGTGTDYGINGQQQLQHTARCPLKLLLSCSWLSVKGCNAVKSANNERGPCSNGAVTRRPSPVVCVRMRLNSALNPPQRQSTAGT